MKQVCRGIFALAVIAGSSMVLPATVTADRDQQAPASQGVPADLKPLLVGPASEMRLVVTRYQPIARRCPATTRAPAGSAAAADGGGGGGGRRRCAGRAAQVVPLSPARLSRLKRFDLDWQAALAKLDTSKLSPAAKTDLDDAARRRSTPT